MSEYDLHSNVLGEIALAVQDITSDTTTVGAIIDTKGFESIEFFVTSGTITDGAYALVLEEGDDPALADATVVPVDNILGSLTGFIAANDDTVLRVGSIGKKQFQRLSLASTGVTAGGTNFTALAVKGNPKSAPTVGA